MPELFKTYRDTSNVHWLNDLPLHPHLDSVRWYESTDPVSRVTIYNVFTIILRPFHVEDNEPLTTEVMTDIRARVWRIVEGLRGEGYSPENMRLTEDCMPWVLGLGISHSQQNIKLALYIRGLLSREWGTSRRKRMRQTFGHWRRRVLARRVANQWMDRCMRPEKGMWFKMCQRRFLALAR